MNRILILSREASDLSDLILANCPGSALYSPFAQDIPVNDFEALCVLGGNEKSPLLLPGALRCQFESFRAAGKPVFTEYVASIGGSYLAYGNPTVMTHHRVIYVEGGLDCEGLTTGDIMDGHYNNCAEYIFIPKDAKPILFYHSYINAHDHMDMPDEKLRKGLWALYKMDANTLVCGFRLCNFRRARISPVKEWESILTGILRYLAGEKILVHFRAPLCTFAKGTQVCSYEDVREAVARGIAWFENADMIVNGGAGGFREGLSHIIHAQNGVQNRANYVRVDCSGESGGAFLMDAILTGNEKSRAIYQANNDFCMNYLQVKDGPHKGMMRWSEIAWEVCYQDDACRCLIPSLLEANFAGGTAHFEEILDALEYLVKTTGCNGVRVGRTDIPKFTEDTWEELRSSEGELLATYNTYYLAALMLAYRAGGPLRFLELAEKGMESYMEIFPDTPRGSSETETDCRLILPLAILYQLTGKEKHKQWLYQVTAELEKMRHESGGYLEWDTGYRGIRFQQEDSESSLLSRNGDPVVDQLYSNNWLPLGFAYAYFATGDEMFHKLWTDIASFFVSSQIRSQDPTLDGAWSRAFDVKRWEINGIPHDVGWGPCCIETGWTMGAILTGLQFMKLIEDGKL